MYLEAVMNYPLLLLETIFLRYASEATACFSLVFTFAVSILASSLALSFIAFSSFFELGAKSLTIAVSSRFNFDLSSFLTAFLEVFTEGVSFSFFILST